MTPDAARVLKLLAAGMTTQEAADASSWPRERVTALARGQKGWLLHPDTDRVYEPGRNTVTLPAGVAELADQHLPFELLARAEASNDPQLRRLAATVRDAMREIPERLANAREAAALAAEIRQLKKQLAAKEARYCELTGEQAPTPPAAPASRRVKVKTKRPGIRAWAASQGLDCPANGRIPKAVETAYDEAHGGTP